MTAQRRVGPVLRVHVPSEPARAADGLFFPADERRDVSADPRDRLARLAESLGVGNHRTGERVALNRALVLPATRHVARGSEASDHVAAVRLPTDVDSPLDGEPTLGAVAVEHAKVS